MIKVVTCLAVLFLVACEDQKQAKNEGDTLKDERVPVEIETLQRGSIESVVLSSTNLEAEESVGVYSRATNQVAQLLVEEGDQVEAGQLLVRLEDDAQRMSIARTSARLDKAKREYARAKDLYEKEFVSQEDINNATYELKQAELEYTEAERNLSYTRITAPIAGTITSRKVNLGDLVNINQHLFDLVDFNSIVARVYLPEKNLARLTIGQKARLSSQAVGKDVFEGHVARIAPVVDARTGTVKVTVAVDDTQRLRPGMYVDVALVMATENQALLIPKRALIYDNDQIFVFRVKRGGPRVTAERVQVEASLTDENKVMPAGGFADGDEIVVAGHTGLKDKAPVRILGEPDPEGDRGNNDTADKEKVALK